MALARSFQLFPFYARRVHSNLQRQQLRQAICLSRQYNLVCRRIETTLFPILRANGMVFAAFRFVAALFSLIRLSLFTHLLKNP